MVNLNIEMPDDLVRSLEGIAAARRKSIQQLVIEQLSSLVEDVPERRAGSAAAVLRVMQEPPHPTAADVDELDALIAAPPPRARGMHPPPPPPPAGGFPHPLPPGGRGRFPAGPRDLFSD